MLALIIWATAQYGAASLVSIIGSVIVVFANPQVLPVLGFVPAAFLFDLALFANHHKIELKPFNISIIILITIACAYLAAIVNGFLILNLPMIFILTVWAGWNVLGGVIGVVFALPIIEVLEKAQVKRVITD